MPRNGSLTGKPVIPYIPRLVRYAKILFDNFGILAGVIRPKINGLPVRADISPKHPLRIHPRINPWSFAKADKKVLILIIACITLLLFSFPLYAQDYKIIKVKGQVLLRQDESSPWQKAKKGDSFSENYELMTKQGGECTFAAGDTVNKALTLKENSQLKVSPEAVGRLELTRGRVFSLIEKMDQGSTFEIKTPVVVAGVRGTGWSVEAEKGTSVKCFEGKVYAKGLDENGSVVSDTDIPEGSGVQVREKGEMEKPFEVSAKDKKEWKSFKGIVKNFIGKPIGKVFDAVGGITEGMVDGYVGNTGANPYNR